jgi:hypothetical protein
MIIHKMDPDGGGNEEVLGVQDRRLLETVRRHPGPQGSRRVRLPQEERCSADLRDLDPATGKIVDKNGNAIKAEYGLYMKEDPNGKVTVDGKKRKGFGTPDGKINVYVAEYEKYGFNPLPTFKSHPWHWDKDGSSKLKGEEMVHPSNGMSTARPGQPTSSG